MPTHVISVNEKSANPSTGDVQIPIFQKKIILNNAQIKVLPTTPVNIIPPPGAGKLIIGYAATLNFKTSAGGYTNILYGQPPAFTSFNLGEMFSRPSIFYITEALVSAQDLILSLTHRQITYKTGENEVEFGMTQNGETHLIEEHINSIGNIPLVLQVDNLDTNSADLGDFTGGHADNTLEVTVFYSIVDL